MDARISLKAMRQEATKLATKAAMMHKLADQLEDVLDSAEKEMGGTSRRGRPRKKIRQRRVIQSAREIHTGPAVGNALSRRTQIARLIHNKPMTPEQIAKKGNIPLGSVTGNLYVGPFMQHPNRTWSVKKSSALAAA